MAGEVDQEEERRKLEEFQRKEAEAAILASRGQPNAIPAERAVDRTVDQLYAARGLQPGSALVNPGANPEFGVGNYIDRFGTPIGPTQDQTGYLQKSSEGAVGIQGVLSPREEQFWAANPMGAVKHPETGDLIGLGADYGSRQKALEDIQSPEQLATSRLPPPDFIRVPEIDPALAARRNEIANEIATTENHLRGANTNRVRGQASQYDLMSHKLNTLYHADSALATEFHRQSHEQANAADQNRKAQEKYNINRDATAANIALARITASPGSDEYKRAIVKIHLDHPYASQDPRVEAALVKAATFHDERAAIQARAKEAGLVEEMTGYGQKGPSVKFVKPEAALQAEAIQTQSRKDVAKDLSAIGMTPEQFAQRTKVERGTFDANGKFTGANEGPHVRVTVGDQGAKLSTGQYARLNAAIPASRQQTDQPTATPVQSAEVTRTTQDGRTAIFDFATKKFLRYAQ